MIALDFEGLFPSGLHDWQDAERLGLALMLALGFEDAMLSAKGADAGIDIHARDACCQVKHWSGTVGRGELQRLVGAAFGRDPVFLAATYSAHAVSYADQAHLALFTFDPTARVLAANGRAVVLASGPHYGPMTDQELGITERLERVSRNVGTLGAQVGLVVARGKAQSARNRRRTNRMVAKASRALDEFAKANDRLLGAQRRGSLRGAEKAVDDMERAVRSAAEILDVRLPL